MRLKHTFLLFSMSVSLTIARGATVVAPANLGQLAVESDAVVLAKAASVTCSKRGALIQTTTTFVVETSLSGPALDTVDVETPGGVVGDLSWLVPGSPRFEVGEEYVLFLKRESDSKPWQPSLLSYGLLHAKQGTDLLVPMRESRLNEVLKTKREASDGLASCYRKGGTLKHLREVIRGETPWNTTSVLADLEDVEAAGVAETVVSDCSFFTTSSGARLRWGTFDESGVAPLRAAAPGGVSLDHLRLLSEAMELWMEVDATSLNLLLEGAAEPTIACTRGEDALDNVILFSDPCSDIPDLSRCSGVLAFGGPLVSGTHQFDGETWVTVSGWIVVVNNGTECIGESNFRLMLAHELGHGLGFGHVEDPDALMYESCCNGINSTDSFCARYAYPQQDSDNQRPQVDAGTSTTITGYVARLEATVLGDGLPANSLQTTWRLLDGPADVTFADPTGLNTEIRFSVSGPYLLAITADDGELIHTDTVELDVDVSSGPLFVRGDANADSSVDLSDAVFSLTYLFLGGPPPGCLKTADVDDTGEVDLSDPIYLLSHLFLSGPPPHDPSADCGLDPTDDELSCDSFLCP